MRCGCNNNSGVYLDFPWFRSIPTIAGMRIFHRRAQGSWQACFMCTKHIGRKGLVVIHEHWSGESATAQALMRQLSANAKAGSGSLCLQPDEGWVKCSLVTTSAAKTLDNSNAVEFHRAPVSSSSRPCTNVLGPQVRTQADGTHATAPTVA